MAATLQKVACKAQKKATESIEPMLKERQVLEGQIKTIQGELRELVNMVKSGSASVEVAAEIQRLEAVKKELAGRVVRLEAQSGYSQRAVYDVDVIQGALQRFALFINRLPVDLKIKAILMLVERVIIYKDHIVIKVLESPVVEVQKALDEKLVLGGQGSPEQWGLNRI